MEHGIVNIERINSNLVAYFFEIEIGNAVVALEKESIAVYINRVVRGFEPIIFVGDDRVFAQNGEIVNL